MGRCAIDLQSGELESENNHTATTLLASSRHSLDTTRRAFSRHTAFQRGQVQG